MLRDYRERAGLLHKKPHIHVKYQDDEAIISISDRTLINYYGDRKRTGCDNLSQNADKRAHDMKNLKLPMNKMYEYKTALLEKIRKDANNHLSIQSRLSKMIDHHSLFKKCLH